MKNNHDNAENLYHAGQWAAEDARQYNAEYSITEPNCYVVQTDAYIRKFRGLEGFFGGRGLQIFNPDTIVAIWRVYSK